jgi:hypothetical protein
MSMVLFLLDSWDKIDCGGARGAKVSYSSPHEAAHLRIPGGSGWNITQDIGTKGLFLPNLLNACFQSTIAYLDHSLNTHFFS